MIIVDAFDFADTSQREVILLSRQDLAGDVIRAEMPRHAILNW